MRSLLKVTGVLFLTSFVTLALAVAFDQYLHGQYDYWLLNYRGYRGSVVGEKQQDEHRVGVFGGSVAMGYGVLNDESIAGHLQHQANDSRVTTLNLAATGDDGLSFLADNYQAFKYLQIDTLAFLLYFDPIRCQVNVTSVRDWPLFIKTLTQHHGALATYVMDVASVQSPAAALDASGAQRARIIETFNTALTRPDAVDADRFAEVQRRYGISDAVSGQGGASVPGGPEFLACFTNLLLLQPTLHDIVDPVDGVAQQSPSRRMGNLTFRHFGYWFILEEIAWERYFAFRYGSVDEGYRTDPVIRWVADTRAQIRQRGRTNDTQLDIRGHFELEASMRPYTSTDFFKDVIGQGKQVHILLYPSTNPSQHAAHKMYFDFRFRGNDAVRVVDLSAVFLPDAWDSYFLDGLHFSALGNQAAAKALSDSLKIDSFLQ